MAKGSKTRIIGRETVAKNLREAGERWTNALATALYLEANNIMAISKRRVPVDTGALRSSGYVTLPNFRDTKILVEMGYGGTAKGYAMYVHEIPSPEEGAPHPEQWSPGKRTARHQAPTTWKYLEHPINERTPDIPGNLLKLAKAAFERGETPTQGPFPTAPKPEGSAATKSPRKSARALGKPKKPSGKGKKGGK